MDENLKNSIYFDVFFSLSLLLPKFRFYINLKLYIQFVILNFISKYKNTFLFQFLLNIKFEIKKKKKRRGGNLKMYKREKKKRKNFV